MGFFFQYGIQLKQKESPSQWGTAQKQTKNDVDDGDRG